MTVLNTGSTKAFASGWELAFSGKQAGKKTAKSKAAAKPTKAAKKKTSKPKAASKPAKKKAKR